MDLLVLETTLILMCILHQNQSIAQVGTVAFETQNQCKPKKKKKLMIFYVLIPIQIVSDSNSTIFAQSRHITETST